MESKLHPFYGVNDSSLRILFSIGIEDCTERSMLILLTRLTYY